MGRRRAAPRPIPVLANARRRPFEDRVQLGFISAGDCPSGGASGSQIEQITPHAGLDVIQQRIQLHGVATVDGSGFSARGPQRNEGGFGRCHGVILS